MTTNTTGLGPEIEKLVTMKAAADAFGLQYWQVQRAVRDKLIPSYTPFNSRPRLRLSEVDAFVNASKTGGER